MIVQPGHKAKPPFYFGEHPELAEIAWLIWNEQGRDAFDKFRFVGFNKKDLFDDPVSAPALYASLKKLRRRIVRLRVFLSLDVVAYLFVLSTFFISTILLIPFGTFFLFIGLHTHRIITETHKECRKQERHYRQMLYLAAQNTYRFGVSVGQIITNNYFGNTVDQTFFHLSDLPSLHDQPLARYHNYSPPHTLQFPSDYPVSCPFFPAWQNDPYFPPASFPGFTNPLESL